MVPQELGGLRVDRIVEIDALLLPLDLVLPGIPREAVEAISSLLPAGSLDSGTLALQFSFHSYLVRDRHHTILIDTCFGNDKDRPGLPPVHRRQGDFLARLAQLGVAPEDVDFVLCTHLHADHVGWNTRLIDGRWVPTFPNARYVMAQNEFDHWKHAYETQPLDGATITAFEDSVLPVVQAGLASFVTGDHAIGDAIRLEPLPGHSAGHQIVHLTGTVGTGLMTGDAVHHPILLLNPEWETGFCDDPAKSARQRRSLLERYAETDTILFPAHFRAPCAGRVKRAGGAFRFEFVVKR